MNPDLFALLAEALRDPVTGLNKLAESCPQDASADPLPVCGIVTAMEEGWAGRFPLPEEVLETGPICVVRQADEYSVGGNAQEAAVAELPVLIGVGMLLSETHTGLYLVAQFLRTALRSILLRFAAAGPPGVIARNQVQIEKPSQVLYPLLQPAASTNVLVAAAILTFPLYDPWSLGAHVAPPAP